jgi:predicted RNA polymerase sigma factor
MTHSAEWIGRSPAIAPVNNAEAERWEDTGWEQIVLLYDMLLHLASSPVTRLHRAIAVRYAAGTPNSMTSPASSAITTCTTPAAPSCCVS